MSHEPVVAKLIPAKSVVVGVDGSEGSFEALMWATHHAHRTGLPLKIVTVTEIPAVYTAAGAPTMPPGSTFDDLVQRGVDINLRAMDDAEAFNLGIAVSGKAVVGTPVVSLIDATPAGDVLVVSATSQHGRMTDVLGSVATGVSHRAHGPIVIVHGPVVHPATLQRIIVGIDGCDESRVALGWACDLAIRIGASIEVVHGWEYPYRTKDAFFGSPKEIMQRDATALADEELGELDPERRAVVTATHVLEGKASDVLIDASKDADLVVVGSRGRGGVRSLLMGSVSRTVVQHAMSTVVLVPSAKHWRET
jgi:nucleotide-binding universal stress UspA family protein